MPPSELIEDSEKAEADVAKLEQRVAKLQKVVDDARKLNDSTATEQAQEGDVEAPEERAAEAERKTEAKDSAKAELAKAESEVAEGAKWLKTAEAVLKKAKRALEKGSGGEGEDELKEACQAADAEVSKLEQAQVIPQKNLDDAEAALTSAIEESAAADRSLALAELTKCKRIQLPLQKDSTKRLQCRKDKK